MDNQEMLKKTYGLLMGVGFRLNNRSDGKYSILNRNGEPFATGDLVTVYNCALRLSQDAKQNPGKYAVNVPVDQLPGQARSKFQAGREMAKKLNKGK